MTTGPRSDLEALRRVWPLLGISAPRLLASTAWGALTLVCAVGLAAVSAWLIARASQMPSVLDLTVAVVAVRALGIGRGVFRYLERLGSHDVALRGAATLRERLYAVLAVGRPDAVATLRRGEVLRRWGADVDDVGDLVVRAVLPTAVATVVSVVSVALVAAFSPAVAAVLALCLLAAGIAAPMLAARAVRDSEIDGGRARGDVSAAAMTVIDGAAELSVGGRLEGAVRRLRVAEDAVRRTRDRAAWPAAAAQAITLAAMGVSVVAALVLGAAELAAGQLEAVELAVVVLTPLAAFEGVGMLATAAVHTVRAADAARRLDDLLTRAEQHRGAGTASADGPARVVATDLAVGWPGREPLLHGIDLELEPGSAIAIVGSNGSGKTTLLATMAGMLDPAGGSISIAGHPSAELADGAAADAVVLVTEDAHLFDTTILENLRVARGDVTEDEARAALKLAGLSGLIDALPDGLDTHVGAAGAAISGGERRRLLIARALVSRAPMLLLDEPDEHLDPATANRLLEDVLALRAHGRGIAVVSHRDTDVLRTADRVIRLDRADHGAAAERVEA